MKIHYLQHVRFEDIAYIGDWAYLKHHEVTGTKLYETAELPTTDTFDWLVVMGGPMGVHDEAKYPWMAAEKRLIEQAVSQGKAVLGICLGAQLIADVLGAKVYKNQHKEIGWWPVIKTEQAQDSELFCDLPSSFIAFHWHADTFDIPDGAVWTARSKACAHQAFEYNEIVAGLQFHLESTRESIDKLLKHSKDDIDASRFVQTANNIRSQARKIEPSNIMLIEVLDKIERAYTALRKV